MFNNIESGVLIVLYEEPDVSHTSYTLTQRLNPPIQIGIQDYEPTFENVRDATEEHIVRGLVRGKRLKGADGIYFSDIKLTSKGEQAAIQERKRRAELEKALPEITKQANAVIAEMKRFEEKK
jgi:hypothetical protein